MGYYNLILKKFSFVRFFLVLSTFICFSCDYTLWKKNELRVGNIPRYNKQELLSLGYQKVNNFVFEPYCLSCHKKGKNKLTQYQEVVSQMSVIYQSVFETGEMPRNKTLPMPLKSMLLSWIENGAPEFPPGGNSGEPVIPQEPLMPTFASIKSKIFDRYCSDCHDPQSKGCQEILPRVGHAISNESKGYSKESCQLELGIYDQLLNGQEEVAKELVIPGDPDNSQLIISVERADGKNQMPPPEEGYSPLSEEERKVIREWILKGALN